MLWSISLLCLLFKVHHGYGNKAYIVHGVVAEAHQFPYAAFIEIEAVTASWQCGSSVVNQRVLLTAAHCLEGSKTSEILIFMGHTNIKQSKIFNCQRYEIHEEYNRDNMLNDIAVILSETEFKLGPFVKRVVIMMNPPMAEFGIVAGWGIIEEDKMFDITRLRYTKQLILTDEDCLKTLQTKADSTICAKSDKNGPMKGYPAAGDSGSGLVINDFIQIGIVSYREPKTCKSLTVYTYVPAFIDWIRVAASNSYCNFE